MLSAPLLSALYLLLYLGNVFISLSSVSESPSVRSFQASPANVNAHLAEPLGLSPITGLLLLLAFSH